MNKMFPIIGLSIFLSCNLSDNKSVSNNTITSEKKYQYDKELEYIKIRDNYIENLNKLRLPVLTDSVIKLDNDAVADLEKRLFEILKDSQYSSQGKINLRTLLPFADFGLLDGLAFEKDSIRIVYTSKKIFIDFFKEEKISQFDNLTPKNLGDIFSAAYITDARGYNLTSFKIISKNDIQEYGMIGSGTNGFGPILPQYLFVFASKGNFIYMAAKELKQPFKELAICKSQWDSIYQTTQKLINEDRSSTSNFTKEIELMEQAMDIYCDCYQKELKSDSQFRALQKQIEIIAKYLEH